MRTEPKTHVPRNLKLVPRQAGSFLLEALIAILVVAFGVLGLIGLEARVIQNVDDAQYRAEAAFLANALLGQMWAYDQTKVLTDFDSGSAGPAYTEFKSWVQQRLPGAALKAPSVKVTAGSMTPTSWDVVITIYWTPPGDNQHFYETAATVGTN
jgi:type IV pilus assembly protein PilV